MQVNDVKNIATQSKSSSRERQRSNNNSHQNTLEGNVLFGQTIEIKPKKNQQGILKQEENLQLWNHNKTPLKKPPLIQSPMLQVHSVTSNVPFSSNVL